MTLERPGPDSLVFRRMADDRALLIGGATLVLQVADPTVGAGVKQHSNFKAEPWRRLYGTLVSLATIVYGTTADASSEVERLRQMHESIRGVDRRGRTYSALRPAPWAWVHGTLAWSVIRLNELFRTPFTGAEAEQYWCEWLAVGRLLGVRDGDLPDTYAGFAAMIDALAATELEDNQSVRDVVEAVSQIPPPTLATRLDLRLTDREQRRLRRFTALVAGLRRLLPRPLRPGPAALLIQWRARRRWDARSERAFEGAA
jgi:uncharacterized protein (DUF2236 family)